LKSPVSSFEKTTGSQAEEETRCPSVEISRLLFREDDALLGRWRGFGSSSLKSPVSSFEKTTGAPRLDVDHESELKSPVSSFEKTTPAQKSPGGSQALLKSPVSSFEKTTRVQLSGDTFTVLF